MAEHWKRDLSREVLSLRLMRGDYNQLVDWGGPFGSDVEEDWRRDLYGSVSAIIRDISRDSEIRPLIESVCRNIERIYLGD